ncbi:hypothetical protein J1N35_043148 [Gossypium stocksii]|uniref:Uncharacterized protein n=1 Tax=Gossypium stocksii TaxID=47602 RepID=A0A9D3U6S9_9ROSI|nr:hypothetical protein J1N35_043148 [Gossypium stocksii]
MLEKREKEIFILTKKLEDDNSESLFGVKNLTAQVNNLLSEMETLQAEKALLQENLAFKGDEASNQAQSLMDERSSVAVGIAGNVGKAGMVGSGGSAPGLGIVGCGRLGIDGNGGSVVVGIVGIGGSC